MHLSHFGVISIDGSVTKPEPGLDFSGYQTALAQYRAALKLKARVQDEADRKKPCKRDAMKRIAV